MEVSKLENTIFKMVNLLNELESRGTETLIKMILIDLLRKIIET